MLIQFHLSSLSCNADIDRCLRKGRMMRYSHFEKAVTECNTFAETGTHPSEMCDDTQIYELNVDGITIDDLSDLTCIKCGKCEAANGLPQLVCEGKYEDGTDCEKVICRDCPETLRG